MSGRRQRTSRGGPRDPLMCKCRQSRQEELISSLATRAMSS